MFFGRLFRNANNEAMESRRLDPYHCDDNQGDWCEARDATLVTSRLDRNNDRLHAPVLDIDFPCELIESSTPGHFHLYLDKQMTWYQYRILLEALKNAGIIEPGFYLAATRRGYTSVRTPWTRKPERAA